jgi:hypothetical protein
VRSRRSLDRNSASLVASQACRSVPPTTSPTVCSPFSRETTPVLRKGSGRNGGLSRRRSRLRAPGKTCALTADRLITFTSPATPQLHESNDAVWEMWRFRHTLPHCHESLRTWRNASPAHRDKGRLRHAPCPLAVRLVQSSRAGGTRNCVNQLLLPVDPLKPD